MKNFSDKLETSASQERSRNCWLACSLVVVLFALLLGTSPCSDATDSECSVDSLKEGIRSGVIILSDPAANRAITLERKNLNHEFGIYHAFYFMTGSASKNACAFYDSDYPDGVVTFGEALSFGCQSVVQRVECSGGQAVRYLN